MLIHLKRMGEYRNLQPIESDLPQDTIIVFCSEFEHAYVYMEWKKINMIAEQRI